MVQINSPHSIQLRNIKKDTWNKRPVYVDRIKKIFVEKRIQHTKISANAAECTDHTPNARAEPIPKHTDSTPKQFKQSTEPETVSFTGRIVSSRPLGTGTEYNVLITNPGEKPRTAWIDKSEIPQKLLDKYHKSFYDKDELRTTYKRR